MCCTCFSSVKGPYSFIATCIGSFSGLRSDPFVATWINSFTETFAPTWSFTILGANLFVATWINYSIKVLAPTWSSTILGASPYVVTQLVLLKHVKLSNP
jgi:hypothetical protein